MPPASDRQTTPMTHAIGQLHTPGYQCFNIKWGVFDQDQLAVATATNFGMKGPGRLYIFNYGNPNPARQYIFDCSQKNYFYQRFDAPDALYDLAWSESAPTIVIAASANGSILLYDLNSPTNGHKHSWTGLHSREVNSVDWNLVNKETFVTASFDGSISISNAATGQVTEKRKVAESCNEAAWNPRDAYIFCVVSSDGSIQLHDTRQRDGAVQTISNAHAGEILCMDWNKYEPAMIATGGVDQQVKIWDFRSLGTSLQTPTPIANISGHYRAVRRVKWSPFHRNRLSSCGYDMTVRSWVTDSLVHAESPPYTAHTEFVLGLGYSLKRPGVLATCSWDDSIHFLLTKS